MNYILDNIKILYRRSHYDNMYVSTEEMTNAEGFL